MAVAFQSAVNSGDMTNLTSKTWNHTCGGADRALVVGLSGYDPGSNLSGVVAAFDGASMTKLGARQSTNDNNVVLFGLVNPPTGSKVVSVTGIPAGYIQLAGGSVSFTGVDPSTPFGSFVSAAAQVVNVPSMVTGDMIVDIEYSGGAGDAPPTSGGTKRVTQASTGDGGYHTALMSTRAGSGTVATGYTTITDPAIGAVRILQVASNINVAGLLAAQSAVIAGTAKVIIKANGALVSAAAALAASMGAKITVVGNIASGGILLEAEIEVNVTTHFIAALQAQVAEMGGTMTLGMVRLPEKVEVRYRKKGYKRPFTIYIKR